jgi:hypothetical protein
MTAPAVTAAASAARTAPRVPWNKGKLAVRKPPLKLKEIWTLRTRLQLDGRTRDLALDRSTMGRKGRPQPGRDVSDARRRRTQWTSAASRTPSPATRIGTQGAQLASARSPSAARQARTNQRIAGIPISRRWPRDGRGFAVFMC